MEIHTLQKHVFIKRKKRIACVKATSSFTVLQSAFAFMPNSFDVFTNTARQCFLASYRI